MPEHITLDQTGVFGPVKVFANAITVSLEHRRVRFNHSFEVIGATGSIITSLDPAQRTGDLQSLWKLSEAEVAKVEMDTTSFRIVLADGRMIRSANILDVRQPDLQQVDFWTPILPDTYKDEPDLTTMRHYPEVLAQTAR
jgi:hypothetical protein